jgi:CheY-like chemotaxis protein
MRAFVSDRVDRPGRPHPDEAEAGGPNESSGLLRPGPAGEPRAGAGNRGRVLIVEDEADLAWVEQFNLELEGYEVEVALEGRSAIAALDRFAPDVLVLDVMLPHVNGWQVLERAHELPGDRRPRVILVSAVAGIRELADAEGIPLGGILSKPFDMEDLVRMVEDTMGCGPAA